MRRSFNTSRQPTPQYSSGSTVKAASSTAPAHKVPEPVYAAITENFEKLKKAMQGARAAKP